jgi:hypothetical protein
MAFNLQFVINIMQMQMHLYGTFGNVMLCGNLFVAEAIGYQLDKHDLAGFQDGQCVGYRFRA